MFKPTHKSIIKNYIDEIPYTKPVRKQGALDSIIQAPNRKSETVYGGFVHARIPRKPDLRNNFT